MTNWEYLEAQYHITGNNPTKLFVLNPYAELYHFDITKAHELKELGEDRWNLIMMLTDFETNVSRLIFRRPK